MEWLFTSSLWVLPIPFVSQGILHPGPAALRVFVSAWLLAWGGGGFADLRVACSALWQVEIAVQPGSIRLVRSLWTLSSEKAIPLLGGAGEFRAERIRGLFAYRLVYSVPQARPVRIAAGYGLEEFEFVARRLNASADCVPQ